MKDLVAVFKILNVLADRVDAHPIYTQPLIDILQICSLPFLKERASDETSYKKIARESVAQLGANDIYNLLSLFDVTCVYTNVQRLILSYYF